MKERNFFPSEEFEHKMARLPTIQLLNKNLLVIRFWFAFLIYG